jgi:hypothetical protein
MTEYNQSLSDKDIEQVKFRYMKGHRLTKLLMFTQSWDTHRIRRSQEAVIQCQLPRKRSTRIDRPKGKVRKRISQRAQYRCKTTWVALPPLPQVLANNTKAQKRMRGTDLGERTQRELMF